MSRAAIKSVARRQVCYAEYSCRYEQERRHYDARHAATCAMSPGEYYLAVGRLAWIDTGASTVARWCRYASHRRGLRAMNHDGTHRPWDPRTIS